MYLPESFRMDDRGALLEHASAHPFATLVTRTGDGLEASHVPLLVDAARGVLRGHLARENPQLAHFEAGAHALAVFHGPHAYVSPSVYTKQPSVPTWNYVVVHVRGRSRVVGEAELRATLDDLVTRFDATGWRFDLAANGDADYVRRMVGAVAGFEVTIDELEGKWKLSQNRPPEDQERVAEWLERGDAASRDVAALMRERLRSQPR
jgi:transcriptional regulator